MTPERKALFLAAASCQGGSDWPNAFIAEVLGVPHPIRMEALIEKVADEGEVPEEMYPWFYRMRKAAHAIPTGARWP